MSRYLVRRILFLILVLFLVSFLTFIIFLKLPATDPARLIAGRQTNPEILAEIRTNLGLDKPWYIQYGRFAKGLVPWPSYFLNEQVYYSYGNFIPVKEEIYRRLPMTVALTLGAAVLWLIIGLPIGIVSAIRRRTLADRAGMLFALFGVSAPVFWLGYVMLFVFWFKLGWFPSPGLDIGESVWHAVLTGKFILPWVTLSLLFAAFYARMVRGTLIETMSEDYIRSARAKGLSERRVIFKHGLRAALTPVVTMFGLDVGALLGGAIITETIFDIDGVGKYTIDAIYDQDFPVVMGVTIFAAFFIVPGETLGVVGESGSGKSVTFLTVMSLIPPGQARIEGEVVFRGQDLLKLPVEEMRNIRGSQIGMIFQDPMTSLHPFYRVGNQIAEAIQAHRKIGKKEAGDQAIDMLRRVGIPRPDERARQYPHEFSGGMRQRAMIAMALSLNPDLLIADEPTTALDVTVQAQILELIDRLKQEFNTAVIIITHDLGVVAEHCDHIQVMYAGKIVEAGDRRDIYYGAHHPYTWGLLQSIARVDAPRGERLKPIKGLPPSLIFVPSGCPFHPRCPYVFDRCRTEVPQLLPVDGHHASACHLPISEKKRIMSEEVLVR